MSFDYNNEPFPEKRTGNYRKKQNEDLNFYGKLGHAAQDARGVLQTGLETASPVPECDTGPCYRRPLGR